MRCQIVAEAARSAGRDPLRFSMMIGCVVGRDNSEVAARLAAWRTLVQNPEAPAPLSGTIDEIVTQLEAYQAVGVQRAMLQHIDHTDVEMVAVLGEVATRLAL